jgi:hypothetical protein
LTTELLAGVDSGHDSKWNGWRDPGQFQQLTIFQSGRLCAFSSVQDIEGGVLHEPCFEALSSVRKRTAHRR